MQKKELAEHMYDTYRQCMLKNINKDGYNTFSKYYIPTWDDLPTLAQESWEDFRKEIEKEYKNAKY